MRVLAWLAVIGLAVGAFFLNLHVLMIMWAAIMVPIGLPALPGMKYAYGIMVIVSQCIGTTIARKKDDRSEDEDALMAVLKTVIMSYFISLIGWGLTVLIF